MATTTSISTLTLLYKIYFRSNILNSSFFIQSGISRSVNKVASNQSSDIINGYSSPSTGVNYLDGNGGNDTLLSNPNTLGGVCYMRGSTNTSLTNSETDIFKCSDSNRDHIILSNLYRGSGFAVINNFNDFSFQDSQDKLYLARGTGGDSVVTGRSSAGVNIISSIGYKVVSGIYNSKLSTFVNTASGDTIAVLVGNPSAAFGGPATLQRMLDSDTIRLT